MAVKGDVVEQWAPYHRDGGPEPRTPTRATRRAAEDAVRSLMLRQAGVVSRAQARAAGLSPRQIERMLSTGEWLPVGAGVYRSSVVAPSPASVVHQAFFSLGPRALLADHGAAWWWEVVPDPPETWTFVIDHRRRTGTPIRAVRTFVDVGDRGEHRGLPVMSKPWATLRTAAAWEKQQPGRGIALIDRVKQRKLLSSVDLQQSLGRHPGCWDAPLVRRLLDRTGDDAHSELERLAVSLLLNAGITGFTVNHRTTLTGGRRVEIDIAFVDRRIAIELDGYAYHSDPEAFRNDLRRSNSLMAGGWTVRRFSHADLAADPDGFVERVRELLG